MTYHRPGLRDEVLQHARDLVAAGGLDALSAREVARRAGVSSAAVYRHFDDIDRLRIEVSRLAREALATTMLEHLAAVPAVRDPVARALARFDAMGTAYVAFAAAQPGLFGAAFTAETRPPATPDDPNAWDVLTRCLDDLVEVGVLQPELRPGAELVAWTAVHGLAVVVAFAKLPPPLTTDMATGLILASLHRSFGLLEHPPTAGPAAPPMPPDAAAP